MEPKPIPEVVEGRLELIDEKVEQADEDIGIPISEVLRWLWRNPEVWSDEPITQIKQEFDVEQISDTGMMCLLGVLFGAEWEQAYPREQQEGS